MSKTKRAPRRKTKRRAPRKTAKQRKPDAREDFIDKLVKSAERQIDDITRRIKSGSRDSADGERDARATAALVKVLCALGSDEFGSGKAGADKRRQNEATMQNGSNKDGSAQDGSAQDEDGPRDLDEFRRELGRQMDEIIARRADSAAGGADDAGG